jgi:hypothetical protein
MRTKRVTIILIVVGLLAALTATAYATGSLHPAQPNIVGTWKVVMPKSEGNPDASENLQTFFADGNFIETTSLLGHGEEGPDHGVWSGSDNTYYWTAQLFLFDAKTGDHAGTLKVRAAIRMVDADHFTGQAVGDLIDLAGKVTVNIGNVPFEFTGTRMKVERPYPASTPK